MYLKESSFAHVAYKVQKGQKYLSCTDIEVSADLLKPHLHSQESRPHLVTNVKQRRCK